MSPRQDRITGATLSLIPNSFPLAGQWAVLNARQEHRFPAAVQVIDQMSPNRRSALMTRIRATNTQPEMAVRRMLHGLGYRYILHDKRLPGRPDLVFPSRHKVIFIHGCFWHGHSCGRGFRPKTNGAFWAKKLDRNKERDEEQIRELKGLGWQVLTVWECEVRGCEMSRLEQRLVGFLDT